jgi:capsular polysaccharide biosynthesis protein
VGVFFRALGRRSGSCRVRGKRLFLSRVSDTRKLSNEGELLRAASEYGFERYFPEQSDDSLSDFFSAEALIAPHGAGLADIAFMQAGAHVLELMPSDHRHCYFFTIGRSAGLDYSVLIGQSHAERPKDSWGPSPFDFEVDQRQFTNYLTSRFGRP